MLKDLPIAIEKSILTYIGKDVDGVPITCLYESPKRDAVTYCELRLQGPSFIELSKDYFACFVDINILVTTDSKKAPFKFRRVTGALFELLNDDIPVIMNGKQVGCLRQNSDKTSTKLDEIWSYGNVKDSSSTQQGIIEKHLKMEFHNGSY